MLVIEATPAEEAVLPPLARRFLVTKELSLRLVHDQLLAESAPVAAPYWKVYDPPPIEPGATTFVARSAAQFLGAATVGPHWTGLASISDIFVVEAARGDGIGIALVREVQAWAIATGYPGLCLETQHNNVPACSLYAKAGFRLRGFDSELYSQVPACAGEVALFWYWRPIEAVPISAA